MAWTDLTASQVDLDSPLNATLFSAIKDNYDYLKGLFDASTGHVHDSTAWNGPGLGVHTSVMVTSEADTPLWSVTNPGESGGWYSLMIPSSPQLYVPAGATSMDIRSSTSGVGTNGLYWTVGGITTSQVLTQTPSWDMVDISGLSEGWVACFPAMWVNNNSTRKLVSYSYRVY